ncbi:MAG: Na-translocating system protein MpsC family protein [Solirubrobacteraceae bacterium]
MSATSSERTSAGSVAAEISNAVVRLLSEYTGRGPTRARTHITEELISVVLRDTLTKGEISLIAAGKTELVLAARKAYQEAMGADLTAAVEHHSGRKVLAFLSDNHLEPDIAIESFVLEPRSGEAPDSLQAEPERESS